MADAKISQLPVATTPLAGTELVPIVQSATTKQTTVQAILTGTVPSGTANGVLYLDGSKVATSGSALTFDGTNLRNTSGAFEGIDNMILTALVSGTNATVLTLNSAGTSGITRFQINNSEAMRLTSTGLGIGTSSPVVKLDVNGALNLAIGNNLTWGGAYGAGTPTIAGSSTPGGTLLFYPAGSTSGESMRLDSSGNLGLGVTPSAWQSGRKALQIGLSAAIDCNTTTQIIVSANRYYNGSNDIYINTAAATAYQQSSGAHIWYTAPSGTAGNAISFTQAMTLDSGGSLLVGRTSSAGSAYSLELDNGTSDNRIGMYAGATLTGGLLCTTNEFRMLGFGASTVLTFQTNTTERARITSGGNFKIGGTADRATTEGDKQLVLFDGAAPVGTLANGVSFYSASGEANVMDAAGNATLLSPHDAETNEWIFRSKHTPTGKVLKIDVERLLKFVNDHFGLDAVHEFIEP